MCALLQGTTVTPQQPAPHTCPHALRPAQPGAPLCEDYAAVCDVWALAATLFYLCFGRWPFTPDQISAWATQPTAAWNDDVGIFDGVWPRRACPRVARCYILLLVPSGSVGGDGNAPTRAGQRARTSPHVMHAVRACMSGAPPPLHRCAPHACGIAPQSAPVSCVHIPGALPCFGRRPSARVRARARGSPCSRRASAAAFLLPPVHHPYKRGSQQPLQDQACPAQLVNSHV